MNVVAKMPCLHQIIGYSPARVQSSFRIHLRLILISIHRTSMLTDFQTPPINRRETKQREKHR